MVGLKGFIQKELNYIFKRTDVKGDQAKDRADNVSQLLIYLHNSLPEQKADSVKDIWNLTGKPENTYKAYLFSLQFLSFINNGYETTRDKQYLKKSTEIIDSWLDYESTSQEEIVWYDFTVANRVIIITHYLNLCLEAEYQLEDGFNKRLIDSLIRNGEYLYSDKHYKDNNHGIMMDRALLQLSLIMGNHGEWKDKALARLTQQIKSSFTEEYINVENSPEYHNHTYLLFKELYDFLKANGVKTQIGNIENMLDRIYENHHHMLKPDLTYPLIGDTNKHVFKDGRYIPESIVYNKSGIGFLKSESSYMTIKSGFSNTSHKHFDDLSFTYNYKGDDVFLDGGKYNYNNKDPFRSYIISPWAHNTVIVNKKSYNLNPNLQINAGIVNETLGNDMGYVELINNHYENVEINRKVVNIYPNILFVIDTINSKYSNLYSQVFNVHPNFSIRKLDSNEVVMANKENGVLLKMKQHLQNNLIEYSFGYKNNENIAGFFSEQFDDLKECHNLQFHSEQKNHKYITTIEIIDSAEHIEKEEGNLSIVDRTEEEILFSVNKKKKGLILYSLNIQNGKLVEKLRLATTELIVNEGSLKISIIAEGKELEFACYILQNNKIINKLAYQDAPEFNVNLKSTDNIKVWSFVRSKKNRTEKLTYKNNR